MSVVKTYNFYLDSAYANVRTPVNDTRELTFYLKKAVTPKHPTNRFRIRVNTAEIPFSFQQVNSTNNSFAVEFGTTSIGNCVLPFGNYDILSLTVAIDNAVNQLLVAAGFIATLSTTFDQSTGKCTFRLISASSFSLKFYFGTSILLSMIGFDPLINGAFVTIAGAPTPGATTNSVKNVNVCPTTCIYLSSRSFTQIQNYEALTNGLDITDVIGKIQLTTLPQTYLMYMNYTGEFIEVNNKEVSEINLYLSTNLVDFLDMSDMRWSVHIVMEEIQGGESKSMLSDYDQTSDFTSPDNNNSRLNDGRLNDLVQKKQKLLDQLKQFKDSLTNMV